MAKKVLSIRVDTQKILVTESDFKTTNPHVYRCIAFDTPENVVEDGFITDSATLANAIIDKLKEEKCTEKNVIFTVTSSKIANREITLPLVGPAKLKSLVSTQASEYFPFDLQEYVLAFMIQNKDKKLKKQDLLLFAAPNDLINSYFELAKALGFHLIDIDYDGNSSYQIMRRQTQDRTTMSVQINLQNAMINIMHGDTLMLQRSIPYGLNNILDLTQDVEVFNVKTPQAALNLLSDQHVIHTHLNNDAIKNMKINESMLAISDSYRRNLEYESARVDVTEAFTPMINNFVRVIDYYHSNHADNRIKEVIVTGLGANIDGILDLINNETGIETKKPDELLGVVIDHKITKAGINPIEFLSCIGAIFSPIGFVSNEITQKEERKSSAFNLAAVFAVAAVAAIIMIGFSWIQKSSVESERDDKKVQIENLTQVKKVFDENTRANACWEIMGQLDFNSQSQNDQFNTLMSELKTKLPSYMSVSSFMVADNKITINLSSTDKLPAISQLLIQLKAIDFIENVTAGTIARQEDIATDADVYTFSVTADYVLPVVATPAPVAATPTPAAQ